MKEFRYRLKFVIPDHYPQCIQLMAIDKLDETQGYTTGFVVPNNIMINDIFLQQLNRSLEEVIEKMIQHNKLECINVHENYSIEKLLEMFEGCFTKLLSNIKRLKDETDDKRDNEPTDGAAPSNTTL